MKNKIKGCTHHETKLIQRLAAGGSVKAPPPVANAMRRVSGQKQQSADDTNTSVQNNTDTTNKPAAKFDINKEAERYMRKNNNGTLDPQYGWFSKAHGAPDSSRMQNRLGSSLGFFNYLGDRLSKFHRQKQKDEK